MRTNAWQSIAASVIGLVMLSVADRAQGVSIGFCCQCRCGGETTCVAVVTPSDCTCENPMFKCTLEVLPGTCESQEGCPTGALEAPALGASGLVVAALALSGLGALGVWRATRRTRASG